MHIAVIAAGAMGSAVGARLAAHGATVLTSLEGRSPATVERARAAGIAPADANTLAAADIILSIVPPDRALPLAEWFAPRIGPAAPLYVDCNAISPATARSVAQALAATPARIVDGGIIGPPPRNEGPGPTFYLSGPHAEAALALRQYGLTVKTLDGGIGAASALKMTYAGMTKGFLALGAAMILAAKRDGASAALAAELASSQPEFLARLSRGLPDMLPKAYRWVPEMQEIADFLGPEDPASPIYRAMSQLYAAIAHDQAQAGPAVETLKTFPQS